MSPATPQCRAIAPGAPAGGLAGRAGLATASGVLYFLSFPPVAAGGLAFVALVPLLLAVAGRRGGAAAGPGRGEAFLLGWLCCTVGGTLLVGPSVYEAARRYFELPVGLALFGGALAPQLYGAPYFALFALLAREIAGRGRGPEATALALAAAWTACDLARATFGDGMPWLLLAHSQTTRLRLLQVADLAGASGVSFVVALANAALAIAIGELRGRGGVPDGAAPTAVARAAAARGVLLRLAGLVAIVVGGTALYGHVQLARWADGGPPTARVALIQGNLPDAWRYSLSSLPDALRRMSDLTAGVVGEHPDLVVWPENAVSVSVDANRSALRSLTESLPPDARLLVGAPRAVATGPGRAALRNSAFLLDAAGEVTGVYDKRSLTPWAEVPPWPLSSLPARRVASPGAYSPGDAPALLEVRGHRFATLICSEAMYARLARQSVRAGAELLVNIGNDGWFGAQPAGAQHLDAARLRAVENRRPLVRATTTGISAVIDARGAVVATAPQGQAASLVADVVPRRELTVYTRFGDAFGVACAAATLAALAPRRRRGGR